MHSTSELRSNPYQDQYLDFGHDIFDQGSEDFWEDDFYFLQICRERDENTWREFEKEVELQQEDLDKQNWQFETAPPRHYKKRR